MSVCSNSSECEREEDQCACNKFYTTQKSNNNNNHFLLRSQQIICLTLALALSVAVSVTVTLWARYAAGAVQLTDWLTDWETMPKIALGPFKHCPYASCCSHAAATARADRGRGENKNTSIDLYGFTPGRERTLFLIIIFDVAGCPFDVLFLLFDSSPGT